MSGVKGKSGGVRPGAVRKSTRKNSRERPSKKPSIDWISVEFFAKNGISEADIRASLGISDTFLDAVATDRFKTLVARGHARHRVDLELRINRRGVRTSEADGSVNILALQARNKLDWDRQIPTQEAEPDLGTARLRLGDLLVRLAQQTSQVARRHVSVLEMLKLEADVGAVPPGESK